MVKKKRKILGVLSVVVALVVVVIFRNPNMRKWVSASGEPQSRPMDWNILGKITLPGRPDLVGRYSLNRIDWKYTNGDTTHWKAV